MHVWISSTDFANRHWFASILALPLQDGWLAIKSAKQEVVENKRDLQSHRHQDWTALQSFQPLRSTRLDSVPPAVNLPSLVDVNGSSLLGFCDVQSITS